MIKKKYFSAKFDFKTGLLFQVLLILGILLLATSIILYFIPLLEDNKDLSGVLFAFSILSLGASMLAYFLFLQFSKLARIAEEIEKEEKIE